MQAAIESLDLSGLQIAIVTDDDERLLGTVTDGDIRRGLLRGLDLVIAPGETVAVVGPTGAGKSTLAKLLLRFYDVTDGRVLVDGHDVRGLTLSSLRRQVCLVPQEAFLFVGTLRDNIAFGRPTATDDEE